MKLSCTQQLSSLLVALTMSSGVALASNSATINYAPSGGNVTTLVLSKMTTNTYLITNQHKQ